MFATVNYLHLYQFTFPFGHFPGTVSWVLSVGVISSFICICAIVALWRDGVKTGALQAISVLLVLFWVPGAAVATFAAPFAIGLQTSLANGYFSAWAGLIVSISNAVTVFRKDPIVVTVPPALREGAKMIVSSNYRKSVRESQQLTQDMISNANQNPQKQVNVPETIEESTLEQTNPNLTSEKM